MKKILFLLLVGGISMPSFAQKSKQVAKKTENKAVETSVRKENPAEEMAMMEARMINPMHRFLMEWAGHWREEVKIWSNPKAEPTKGIYDKEGRVMCEGRFLVFTINGQMNNLPYEAQSTIGYDNSKKVFVKTWFDNLGTSILVLEGQYDEAKSQIEFKGTAFNPATNLPINIRQVMKFADPQSQVLEVYMEDNGGKEFKSMEIKSIR